MLIKLMMAPGNDLVSCWSSLKHRFLKKLVTETCCCRSWYRVKFALEIKKLVC